MSSRTSGSFQLVAMAFAVSDLPQPCTPSSSSPLGDGNPNSRALSLNASFRRSSHFFKCASPPTSLSC
jgi:hypothetical protein